MSISEVANTALRSANAIPSNEVQQEHSCFAEQVSPQSSHCHGGQFPQCWGGVVQLGVQESDRPVQPGWLHPAAAPQLRHLVMVRVGAVPCRRD